MDKHNFKIGDKVKLRNPKCFGLEQYGVLVISSFDDELIIVDLSKNKFSYKTFPFLSEEIEYAVKVGEQLVFAFMRTGD